MLPSKLSRRCIVHSDYAPEYTSEYILKYTPGMLSRTLPIALDGTLPAYLTVRSQVSSQDALKYTPKNASPVHSWLHSIVHS